MFIFQYLSDHDNFPSSNSNKNTLILVRGCLIGEVKVLPEGKEACFVIWFKIKTESTRASQPDSILCRKLLSKKCVPAVDPQCRKIAHFYTVTFFWANLTDCVYTAVAQSLCHNLSHGESLKSLHADIISFKVTDI